MSSFSKGLIPHLLVAGIFMTLILLQPDLGTTVIIGCWLLIMLFVGGVKVVHVVSLVLLSVPVLLWLVLRADYRLKRWWAFLNPWEDPRGLDFQIIHSLLAFGSGGIWGVGLGNSKQKLFYLPEAHTDFLLSVLAEELGFVGVAAVILLFIWLITRAFVIGRLAAKLGNPFSALVAQGIGIWMRCAGID